MSLIQLREKNQLTVPKDIVQSLDLHTGDYLEAKASPNQIILTVKEVQDRTTKYKMSDLLGAAKGAFNSTEEIDAYIREGRDDNR